MSQKEKISQKTADDADGYLGEQVFHLRLLGPEAFNLLVDSGIFL